MTKSPTGTASPPTHPCPLDSLPQVVGSAFVSWEHWQLFLQAGAEVTEPLRCGSGLVKRTMGPGRGLRWTELDKAGLQPSTIHVTHRTHRGLVLSCAPHHQSRFSASQCICGSSRRPRNPPGIPANVLTEPFCSVISDSQGWDRAKSGRELAKGWENGYTGSLSPSEHLYALSSCLSFPVPFCMSLFPIHYLLPAHICISGSSHPWGCPGCQIQTAFGGLSGKGTHRCGSSARSRFCGHHTTQDGHERGQCYAG